MLFATGLVALLGGPLEASLPQTATGAHGMVVAGHPEAAQIGLEVLRAGGNAMDAVVATSLALGVAEPYGSGLGGKCAILYYDAGSGKVWFIDGLDAAGGAFDVEVLAAMSSSERAEGGAGVGVPGLVAALALGHGKWGSQPWSELVTPSAELSERGFRMIPGMDTFFRRRIERIGSHPETRRIYLPDGGVPGTGTRVPNRDLARTLRLVAEEGPAGFYEGEVAKKIVEAVRVGGGALSLADFRNYTARLGEPVSVCVEGVTVYGGGLPTTGGTTALLALKALETHAWDIREGFRSVENLDAWARILRHVYPRIQAAMADSPGSPDAWREMITPAALAELRAASGLSDLSAGESEAVAAAANSGKPALDGWTTHFVVADSLGNVASVTQSLSHHFGSGVTAPGTGVVLNNSLKNFSFSDPEGVNYGAPGKRPRSTIAPVIALEAGRPVFALGLPGGGRIPTSTLAVLVDHLYFDRRLGDAIAAPRVHLVRDWSPDPVSRILELESGLPEPVTGELRALGWELRLVTDSEFFGGMNAVEIGEDGRITGWADDRRTNFAIGY